MQVRSVVDGDGDDRNAEDEGANGMRRLVDRGSLAQTRSHTFPFHVAGPMPVRRSASRWDKPTRERG